MYSVDYMYRNYFLKNNKPMLCNTHDVDYWNEYINNTALYDSRFDKLYKGFIYYWDVDMSTLDIISESFIDSVNEHLSINDKIYSELYKIHVLADDAYSIIDNYNLKETEDITGKENGIENNDKYTDDHNMTRGAEKTNTVSKNSPYDNENFYNDTSLNVNTDSRADTVRDIYGAQKKTNTKENTNKRVLERVGNIGIKSTPEIIMEHKKLWTTQAFYDYIFANIAKELLLVGD